MRQRNGLHSFLESGVHFLMRVRRKFNKEIDALTSSDAFVNLTHEQKVYRMRVVTFPLPSGEVETLITDLPQDTFETKKGLYICPYAKSFAP